MLQQQVQFATKPAFTKDTGNNTEGKFVCRKEDVPAFFPAEARLSAASFSL